MNQAKKKLRYRHVEGKHLIEVRIKSPYQLFDARDPAPFRERDLDDDFVEYILSAVKEFPMRAPLKVVITIGERETRDLQEASVREAILNYFSFQISLQRSELRSFLKRAQLFLVIGLIILAACIGVAQSLTVPAPAGPLGILREGIIIFGWVSIWKPIELVLFDWYPIFEKLRYHKKILATEIEIRFSAV